MFKVSANHAIRPAFVIMLVAASCTSKPTDQSSISTDSTAAHVSADSVTTTTSKVDAFNHVDEVITKLSTLGVGPLSSWNADPQGGFMSASPEFSFGVKKSNNISIHLEGVDKDYITSLRIVTSISDTTLRKEGLVKLGEVASKAFEVLGLKMPTPIPNAIVEGKEIIMDGVDYGTSLRMERATVESWTVRLTSRTTP